LATLTAMKLLASLLLLCLPVANGYMYLLKAGNNEVIGTESLRGEKPGNIWNPPKKGGNRIPCGGKGNTAFLPLEEDRLRVAAGQQVRVVGKLTMPKDDEFLSSKQTDDAYTTSFVELSIKYGDRPNFQMTRGHPLTPVWAPTESGAFQLLRNIPEAALNRNATIQVSYSISETVSFYQCVDVYVTGGVDRPAGDFPWGIGPDDKSVDVPDCIRGDCGKVAEDGMKGSYIVMIILIILIAILAAVYVYFCCTRKPADLPVTTPNENQEPLEVEKPPQEPARPKTPPPASPPTEDSDNSPIGHVMYTPAEESDPTPQESSEQKSLDATGSQGRHFHFRYVEENDDDDGAKEEIA